MTTRATKRNLANMSDGHTSAINLLLGQAGEIPMFRSGWSLHAAYHHLMKVEPKLVTWIEQSSIPETYQSEPQMGAFPSLMKTIVFQQLAASAAEPILRRTKCAFLGKDIDTEISDDEISPDLVQHASFTSTDIDSKRKVLINGRLCGLSEAKSRYIRSLADHFTDPQKLKDVNLFELSDEELYSKLTAVDGLGPWSVHMFMLFVMKRSNVLATGDLGVRRGVAKLYGVSMDKLKGKAGEEEMKRLCAHWAPYSSLGCCLMWKSQEIATTGQTASPTKRAK